MIFCSEIESGEIMSKCMRWNLFILTALIVPCLLRGEPIEKKYKISICALFKNEARHLKEWLEYHRLIGVDHFYLYNNSSEDQFEKVLRPYLKQRLVTLIHWPDRMPFSHSQESAAHWALSTQLLAYEHAAKWKCPKETKWLVFLDVDEFLVPVETQSLSEILESYDEFPGVQILSDYFEASNFAYALPSRDLLITTVELTGQPAQRLETSVEKMIIKPEYHTTFSWPPFHCIFKDGVAAEKVSSKELRINKYVNRFKPIWNFEKIKNKFDVDSRLITEEEKKQILELGYEIEDKERAIFKFIPKLRKKMGLENNLSQ